MGHTKHANCGYLPAEWRHGQLLGSCRVAVSGLHVMPFGVAL